MVVWYIAKDRDGELDRMFWTDRAGFKGQRDQTEQARGPGDRIMGIAQRYALPLRGKDAGEGASTRKKWMGAHVIGDLGLRGGPRRGSCSVGEISALLFDFHSLLTPAYTKLS